MFFGDSKLFRQTAVKSNMIFIGGISAQTREGEILGALSLLSQRPSTFNFNYAFLDMVYPKPKSTKFIYDQQTGKFKGYCFMWFSSVRDAELARRNIHRRIIIRGRRINAAFASPR